MYGIITVSAFIFLLIVFGMYYYFAKDLINDYKWIKYETKYLDELEKNLNEWNKGVNK